LSDGEKRVSPLHARSLRGWLKHLAATDRLAVAREGVSLEYELAAIAKKLDGRQAVLFPKPAGHTVSVVSGYVAARGWIAEAMGTDESELLAAFRDASEKPTKWIEVPASKAPAQQVVVEKPDLLKLFPIPRHNEHDSAQYITAGVIVARNPKNGAQNVSIQRIQVKDGRRLQALILPRHLSAFHTMAEEKGEALPIAIVIGADPLTLLASQAVVPIDQDELEIAGSLHGEPLEVVKCVGSEIRVPAQAEIVIEARVLPNVRELEGPFGEFPKTYSPAGQHQVIEVDRVTHRRNPIWHTIVPAELEHLMLGAIPREATILGLLQRSFPNVLDAHLSLGGTCRYHLYVKMKKRRESEAKNVIMAAFGAHFDLKQVTVVDDDVDVHNPTEVEWAVATRFQADRDLVVVAGAQGSPLDPSTTLTGRVDGQSAKMGLDATRPLKYEGHTFTRVRVPGEEAVDLVKSINPSPNAVLESLLNEKG
jgi:2,5-furandicarboxylate decarboxylase 1